MSEEQERRNNRCNTMDRDQYILEVNGRTKQEEVTE